MRGIPHAAFYEVVDFAPELGQQEQDLLEAQLTDAGILDALVVPQEHMEDPGTAPGISGPVSVSGTAGGRSHSQPAPGWGDPRFRGNGRLPACAASPGPICGRGLPCCRMGDFRCGTVHGHSCAEGPAEFLMAPRRAAPTGSVQIREWEERLERAGGAGREKKAEVEALERRLARLKEELEQLPGGGSGTRPGNAGTGARRNCLKRKPERSGAWIRSRSAKQVVALLEQQSRELSRGLPYMRTEEAYEEPLNAAESYQALLGSLGISYSDLLHAADAVEWTEDRIAELRDQADTQSRTNAQTRKQMEVSPGAGPGDPGVPGPTGKTEPGHSGALSWIGRWRTSRSG